MPQAVPYIAYMLAPATWQGALAVFAAAVATADYGAEFAREQARKAQATQEQDEDQ